MKIIEPSATLIDPVNADDIYRKLERCGRVSHLSESNDAAQFVRNIIRRGHESVLEHVSLTFHIICDRAIQNELVRHRHASFTAESTRYIKYDELTFIETYWGIEQRAGWAQYCKALETAYKQMVLSIPPEQARAVLPLCLKSELYMTANLREWRHILRLRTSKAAHPQMRLIMNQILNVFRDTLPVIVEDITND